MKRNRLEVSNYRPVNILCIVSKVLEQAIYTQIEEYLTTNDILHIFHSEFRNSSSTDSYLIYLTNYIRSQVAKGKYTGMILLDLQKAFDTVVHEILTNKLKAMGIGSSGRFRSYLTN